MNVLHFHAQNNMHLIHLKELQDGQKDVLITTKKSDQINFKNFLQLFNDEFTQI